MKRCFEIKCKRRVSEISKCSKLKRMLIRSLRISSIHNTKSSKHKMWSFRLSLRNNKRSWQKILPTWKRWCKEHLRNNKMRLKSKTWWIPCLIKWQQKKSKINSLQFNKMLTTKSFDYEKLSLRLSLQQWWINVYRWQVFKLLRLNMMSQLVRWHQLLINMLVLSTTQVANNMKISTRNWKVILSKVLNRFKHY